MCIEIYFQKKIHKNSRSSVKIRRIVRTMDSHYVDVLRNESPPVKINRGDKISGLGVGRLAYLSSTASDFILSLSYSFIYINVANYTPGPIKPIKPIYVLPFLRLDF